MNLAHEVRICKACPLWETRTLAVPAWKGANYNGIAIMGDAPDRNADLQGKPFVGRTGRLLDDIFSAVGMSRDDFLLMSRLRCKAPNNDINDARAIAGLAACETWTQKEIHHYSPKVIVVMGNTAARPIWGPSSRIGSIRGQYSVPTNDGPIYVATYHPNAALRSPELSKLIMQDLVLAKDLLSAY